MPAVSLIAARLSYLTRGDQLDVLGPLDLAFSPNCLAAILGPSGCGKTSLLEILAGIRRPTSGTIERRHPENSSSGFVFQSPALLPWRRLVENCLLGAEITGHLATARAVLPELLTRYGLAGFESRYPRELSGGMQQRAALVRAVLAGARLLLLDEPFSDSDPRMRLQLQRDLAQLVDEDGLTAVMVTHDVDEALRLADQIVLLTPRPGRVREIFTIETPRGIRLANPHRIPEDLEPIRRKLLEALHSDSATSDGAAE
jgi:NitT/TauT family transport system ATP-binding protein